MTATRSRTVRFGAGAILALLLAVFGAGAAMADTLVLETGTGRHVLNVEIAADEASRERGLMFRRSLAPDAGMLFEFDEDQPIALWMKNTYISLDMLFITADGHVINIVRGAKPESLDILRSDGPARAALELPAGAADRLGVAPGARVVHPFFRNHDAQVEP